MRFTRVFRSGNTNRLTLPRSIAQGLRLVPGDTVSLDHVRDGVVELRSVRYDKEQQDRRKKK